ncbi:ParA family protein [Pseudoalteromonas luteoviolacea]|uniref:ParA family protein n=1 Tax=Pseudoalteromonas luteoviolacea TaxID=43657 RepID=UPI001B37B014|nr:ParA family protein [Pseudoalteromonas luteoviolacea]MBQ4840133.1 ParA family protein [Pseudoalteromonas luteoviolacea]
MGKVTSVSIQKGGPGKTTVCRNLGEEVSEAGFKVLLIDNDPQGNLTKAIFGDELPPEVMKVTEAVTSGSQKVAPGVSNTFWLYEKDEMPEPFKVTENLYIIGATKHLAEMGTKAVDCVYEFKDKMEVLAGEFDHVFIDCPPAAGTLQTAAHGSSDYLVIPTELNEDSIDGVKQQLESAAANKKRLNPALDVLGILVNGKDSHKINIEEFHLENLKELYGDKLFEAVITHSVKVSEARSFNKTVRQHAPKSVQANQFLALTREYLERSKG